MYNSSPPLCLFPRPGRLRRWWCGAAPSRVQPQRPGPVRPQQWRVLAVHDPQDAPTSSWHGLSHVCRRQRVGLVPVLDRRQHVDGAIAGHHPRDNIGDAEAGRCHRRCRCRGPRPIPPVARQAQELGEEGDVAPPPLSVPCHPRLATAAASRATATARHAPHAPLCTDDHAAAAHAPQRWTAAWHKPHVRSGRPRSASGCWYGEPHPQQRRAPTRRPPPRAEKGARRPRRALVE